MGKKKKFQKEADFEDTSNIDDSSNQSIDNIDVMEPDDNQESDSDTSSEKTLTMGEFLSTSKEIKQKYNAYVRIGFVSKMRMLRVQSSNQPYRRTYDDWMRLFVEFADT